MTGIFNKENFTVTEKVADPSVWDMNEFHKYIHSYTYLCHESCRELWKEDGQEVEFEIEQVDINDELIWLAYPLIQESEDEDSLWIEFLIMRDMYDTETAKQHFTIKRKQ